MNHPDDDCTVITDMPLSDEVVDFIEQGLHRDMTDTDIKKWYVVISMILLQFMKSTEIHTCHMDRPK